MHPTLHPHIRFYILSTLQVSTMALLAQRSTSSLVAKRSAPDVRVSNGGIRCRVASLDVAQHRTDERGFVLKEVRVVLKQGAGAFGALAGGRPAHIARIAAETV